MLRFFALILGVYAFSLAASAEDPSFSGIGLLAATAPSTSVGGISADGQMVVGIGNTSSGFVAFRWTKATGLGVLPKHSATASSWYALGVSEHGDVIIGAENESNGPRAIQWDSAGHATSLGSLGGGANLVSTADAVDYSGSVIVGTAEANDGSFTAMRWTAATGMVSLGDLPGGNLKSGAGGVSGDGAVIVGYGFGPSGRQAMRWTQAQGMIGMGGLTSDLKNSVAIAASFDGTTIVGASNSELSGPSSLEAFVWTENTGMIGIGDLPGGSFFSELTGVSADGKVAVGFGTDSTGSVATIWDADDGLRPVKDLLLGAGVSGLEGWRLTSAQDISADGLTICGSGYNPAGVVEGWVAHLPEPETILCIAAVLPFVQWRSRQPKF